MDVLPEAFWLQPVSLENDIVNTVLLWGEGIWVSQYVCDIFVPRAPRIIAFFKKSVKESQRSSPFFFISTTSFFFSIVKIWKMSQFNVGILSVMKRQMRPCYLRKFCAYP